MTNQIHLLASNMAYPLDIDFLQCPLIDTHTHFDIADYDNERIAYIDRALKAGVRHIILIGYQACYFERMVHISKLITQTHHTTKLHAHLAMGLHPLYIDKHSNDDLIVLEQNLITHKNIAIGEIGLDTYPEHLKSEQIFTKQCQFFVAQLELAKQHNLPIMLHIRRRHADVLKLIKQNRFAYGGIAHSFSGGEQEAFAFVKAGFKIGVTGQITNPNAKKLHRTIKAVIDRFGINALVVETDCPDMTPIACQHLPINEPATLPHVVYALSQICGQDYQTLSQQLWHNTCEALGNHF